MHAAAKNQQKHFSCERLWFRNKHVNYFCSELRKNNPKDKRSTSWYTECGLFKNQEKRPNTFWYAEVGLYNPKSSSTPSTSSAENSGTNTTNLIIQDESITETTDNINEEEYYNLKNESENGYYNQSIKSFSSGDETKMDRSFSAEIQLRLQDEPLYQFYNAAVVDVSTYITFLF